MGDRGDEARPQLPPPAPLGPPPNILQPWTSRVDAELAALDSWGRALAIRFGIAWGPTPPPRAGIGGD